MFLVKVFVEDLIKVFIEFHQKVKVLNEDLKQVFNEDLFYGTALSRENQSGHCAGQLKLRQRAGVGRIWLLREKFR